MAVTINEDLIDGAEFEISSAGKTCVRAFAIYGLTAGTGIWQQAVDELSAQKGVTYFSSHPSDGTIYVTRIRPKPFPARSKSSVKVYVTYTTPDLGNTPETVISFSAITRESVTNFDANNIPTFVSYYPKDVNGQPSRNIITELADVIGLESCGLLEIRREESNSPQTILPYINTINSQSWQGGAKGTWLCREIAFDKILYRPGYKTIYRFEYNPKTWLKTVVSISNHTGKPYADIVPDRSLGPTISLPVINHNGFQNFYINQFADFNSLNLPVVFT